jgi:hypothetical protein
VLTNALSSTIKLESESTNIFSTIQGGLRYRFIDVNGITIKFKIIMTMIIVTMIIIIIIIIYMKIG